MQLQTDANAIGVAMRDLESAIADTEDPLLIEKAANLHALLAQGFVDHIVPLGGDWDQVAGNTGGGATLGGGTDKTPPPATA